MRVNTLHSPGTARVFATTNDGGGVAVLTT
jgi:hypothetical protein